MADANIDDSQRARYLGKGSSLSDRFCDELFKCLEFDFKHAPGCIGNFCLDFRKLICCEAHHIGECLTMNESGLCLVIHHCFCVIAADLNKITQNIIVLDLEIFNAGCVDQACLHARDHAPAFVPQLAKLIQFGVVASPYKTTVARKQRDFVIKRRFQMRLKLTRCRYK